MHDRTRIPWTVLALCAGGILAILTSGAGIWLGLGIGLVWFGSLWLLASRPPEEANTQISDDFSTAKMGELVELSGTPILFIENRRISAANRTMRGLLGAHIIGQDIRVALRNPKAIKLLDSAKGGTIQIKGLVRRRDLWQINKQILPNGTAVVELQNKTAETDISRAHTDFVANASHELRTPLASIIGYVETIRDDDDLPPEIKNKFLDTILAEGSRLQSLVSDLMSLSRIEAEKHEQPQERVDLGKLVKSAALDAAGLNRQDRVQFELSEQVFVAGDSRQLEQLTSNLVDNALKYGKTNSNITVELSRTSADEALISVSDIGDGIDPDQIPHLTRRFYRTDPGRSRASGGTGLGLAIVKHIVERHRGRLDIASELGKGTKISVRIPLLETQPDRLS